MLFYQLEIFHREQIGCVGAKMKTRIGDDRIETHFGMVTQPATTVILDEPDLWITEDRSYLRLLRDELEIATVDFDNCRDSTAGLLAIT